MNETMKPKRAYLDSANSASAVLALLAVLAAVPGVIRLYNFMIDARDQKIEVATLLGLGDRSIPGLGIEVREPYVTLSVLIIAVLIPLLVFLFLLAKKSGLRRRKVVGVGLYWFIVLAGLFGLFLGLGLIAKFVSGDLSNLGAIRTDPESLFIAGVSIVSSLLAFVALSRLGSAAIAPNAEIDEDEDEDEDEDLDIRVLESEPVSEPAQSARAVPVNAVAEETRTFTAELEPSKSFLPPAHEIPSPDPEVAPEVTAFDGPAPSLEPTMDSGAPPIPAVDVHTQAAAILAHDLDKAADLDLEESVVAAPEAPAAEDAVPDAHREESVEEFPPAVPILAPKKTPTAPSSGEAPKEREIKRWLVAFPGDDTKVIVILREYVHGRFVREWSEIRLKSDFTRQRRANR